MEIVHCKIDPDLQQTFTYADILGNIQTYPILMDKESEGCMFIFPAHLGHSVHPFYNCDDERISIAGNILWTVK